MAKSSLPSRFSGLILRVASSGRVRVLLLLLLAGLLPTGCATTGQIRGSAPDFTDPNYHPISTMDWMDG